MLEVLVVLAEADAAAQVGHRGVARHVERGVVVNQRQHGHRIEPDVGAEADTIVPHVEPIARGRHADLDRELELAAFLGRHRDVMRQHGDQGDLVERLVFREADHVEQRDAAPRVMGDRVLAHQPVDGGDGFLFVGDVERQRDVAHPRAHVG